MHCLFLKILVILQLRFLYHQLHFQLDHNPILIPYFHHRRHHLSFLFQLHHHIQLSQLHHRLLHLIHHLDYHLVLVVNLHPDHLEVQREYNPTHL